MTYIMKKIHNTRTKILDFCRPTIHLVYNWLKLKSELTNRGFYKISPILLSQWHNGATYFSLYHNGRKYFLKTDFEFNLIQNEATCYNTFSSIPNRGFSLLKYFSLGENYIIFPFVNYKTPDVFFSDKSIDAKTKYNTAIGFISFSDCLYNAKIVYRDVKIDNFYIDENNLLTPIDYSFAISSNKKTGLQELSIGKKTEKVLSGMGELAQTKKLTWDDTIALHKIITQLEQSSDINLNKIKTELEKRNGRLAYTYKSTQDI